MSSQEEELVEAVAAAEAQPGSSKKRKVLQRACDYCRRKKAKCDGPQMPDKRCSRCIARRTECTYVQPVRKSRYTDSYVENLEKRMQKLEKYVNKLGGDGQAALDPEGEIGRASTSRAASDPAPSPGSTLASLRVSQLSVPPASPDDENDSEDDSDCSSDSAVVPPGIISGFSKLSLQQPQHRYHGKSSGRMLIQSVEGMGKEFIRDTVPPLERDKVPPFGLNRIGFKYEPQPWLERPYTCPPISPSDFPPNDLMYSLFEAYFRQINDYLPLLHEPTFLRDVRDGLHIRNAEFGATVLLVCANGARFSGDRRVLLEGSTSWQSAGWKWFERVDRMHKSHLAPVQVYDLQVPALWSRYIDSTTMPHANWRMIGEGMRNALDVGAHRKSMYNPKPTVEEELWRRAFWILLTFEWTSSYGQGRPHCVHDEECYDVGLPIECDDEYWTNDDPEKAFKQPPGKPSKLAYWTSMLRLAKIAEYALRSLYSIRKTRAQLSKERQQWEERVVTELDSELNRWVDTVPAHLRWNPDNCDNELFLGQSATLLVTYYQVQIMVHRPFITNYKRGSPNALASLIICTNAARSCVRTLKQLRQRIGTPLWHNAGTLFVAAMVLVVSMWGQRRSGRHLSAEKDREYVEKTIEMLQLVERQHNIAERLKDVLKSFMSVDVQSLRSQEQPSSTVPPSGMAQGENSTSGPPSTQDTPADTPSSFSTFGDMPSSAFHGAGEFLQGMSNPRQTSDLSQALPGNVLSGTLPRDWQPGDMQPSIPQQAFDFSFPILHAGDGLQAHEDATAGPSAFPVRDNGDPLSSVPMGDPLSADGATFPMDMSFSGQSSAPGAEDIDISMLDHALVNDTMSMWSNAPASFGWQDWEAYFTAVDGSQQPQQGPSG
ncbi:hypothetical protein OH77DRAFT_1429177 [Trametes cingulata]|nr:hypothetical protein OH77DRAFT_1429177 [Trametes cingulata]